MIRAAAALALAVLLAACQQQQPAAQSDPRQGANSDRYNRDRELCRAQVDDYMRTRRNIDDSRREVFRGDSDRYGQGALPEQMAAYGDTRSADRLISSCMESRGWPQPSKAWWERLGS